MAKWAKVALGDASQRTVFDVAEQDGRPDLAPGEDPQWLAWVAAPGDITKQNKGEFVTDGAIVWHRSRGDLIEIRRQRLAEAERAFLARTSLSVAWAGKRIQIDEASQQRISSVALLALTCIATGQPWPGVDWIAADNTTISMATPQQMIGMAMAAAQRVIALRTAYRGAKDALLAADTAAAAFAVDIAAHFQGLD